MRIRRLELDIFYVGTRVALLFLLTPFLSDTVLYEHYAHELTQRHLWPYQSWDFEYPPLAFLFLVVPAWLRDTLHLPPLATYRLFFALGILPFDLLLYLRFRRRALLRAAPFFYVLLTSAMGLLLFDRFDLVVGFCLAWPFLGEEGSREKRSALFWGLGGALKVVPLALVPLTFFPRGETRAAWLRRALRLGALAGIPFLLSCALALALGRGKISFLAFHAQRGVQVESLVGSLALFTRSWVPGVSVGVESNFGAQHLSGSPLFGSVSHGIFYLALLATYAALWCRREKYDLLAGAWLVMLAFVTFGYVFSTQFLLWLIPLALCAAAKLQPKPQRAFLLLFSLAVGITAVHFAHYWDYVNGNRFFTALLLGRNLVLMGIWCLSWGWMTRGPQAKCRVDGATGGAS